MSQSMTGGGVVEGGGVGDYARAPSAEFSLTLSHFMASFMSHNSASLAGEEGGGATVLVCFFFFLVDRQIDTVQSKYRHVMATLRNAIYGKHPHLLPPLTNPPHTREAN